MALIKLLLFAYLAVCVVGAFVSVVIAAIDIWRWHPREERITVTPSALEDLEAVPPVTVPRSEPEPESEVKSDE